MDELIKAMSIAELKTFKKQYKDNESIITIVDGYIEVKVKQEAQDKAKADFTEVITKMVNKLPHPEDIHNIYMRWADIEVEDDTLDAESIVVFNKDGTPTGKEVEDLTEEERKALDDGDLVLENRFPKHIESQWVVELNKGFTVGKANGQPTTSKRAITVHKRNGTQLEFVGNFPSASKACEHLNIPTGGDSATRVLSRDGYISDAYTGTDFTS